MSEARPLRFQFSKYYTSILFNQILQILPHLATQPPFKFTKLTELKYEKLYIYLLKTLHSYQKEIISDC